MSFVYDLHGKNVGIMIEKVPIIFQPSTKVVYPPHNTMMFEEYFWKTYTQFTGSYSYLPIMWTNFYIERKYGTADMSDLQKYLNKLDRSKKYFTIIQYDDGILQTLQDMVILIFGAGGGGLKSIDNLGYPIPLLCMPNPNINKNRERGILCSFVGTMKNGFVIRQKLSEIKEPGFVIKEAEGYEVFKDVMERSVFSLCPRGYGATSFRICEALQHGSIPVYVYDTDWSPWPYEFEFSEIGIKIHESEIVDLVKIVKSKTEDEIHKYVRRGEEIYKKYFTYEGAAKQIIEWVNGE